MWHSMGRTPSSSPRLEGNEVSNSDTEVCITVVLGWGRPSPRTAWCPQGHWCEKSSPLCPTHPAAKSHPRNIQILSAAVAMVTPEPGSTSLWCSDLLKACKMFKVWKMPFGNWGAVWKSTWLPWRWKALQGESINGVQPHFIFCHSPSLPARCCFCAPAHPLKGV